MDCLVGLRCCESLVLRYSKPTKSGLFLTYDKQGNYGRSNHPKSFLEHSACDDHLRPTGCCQLHPNSPQTEMHTACGSVTKPQSILEFVSSGLVPEKYEASPGITLIFGLSSS